MSENGARKIVLVRHGETAWSREGRHTGREDIPLDSEGEVQAASLRERLAGWRFAAVFVSPLQRARLTCRLAGFDAAAEVDPDLQEWDYGDYGGRTAQEIREERPGWLIWKDGVPGGETVDEVGARADRVLARIGKIEGDVALFAHGHLLRILTARWMGMAAVEGEHLAFSAAAISVIGTDRESTVIWRWNDSSHIAGPERW